MDKTDKSLIKNYLSNLQVNVTIAGHNRVSSDWREIDYTPDYNKFYYIREGEGYIKIGEKEYYPKPNQMFLMPSSIKQSYSNISEDVYTKYWCHFTAKIGVLNLFDIIKVPFYIDIKDNKALESIFKDLINNFNSLELSASLLLKSSILRLISFYLDNNIIETVNVFNSSTTKMLNNVIDYINNNFKRNITIEQLSMIAHLHPNYFIRVFKNHLGTSPIHFLNKRRIDEARLLLSSTDFSLNEICTKTGINDIYYLSKLFKEYTGLSPSAYKNMFKKKDIAQSYVAYNNAP